MMRGDRRQFASSAALLAVGADVGRVGHATVGAARAALKGISAFLLRKVAADIAMPLALLGEVRTDIDFWASLLVDDAGVGAVGQATLGAARAAMKGLPALLL